VAAFPIARGSIYRYVGPLMALLSLLDIEHSFGGAPVLDKVNLQVDPGERVCLVGRNGAGKTTLMRIIAGEMKPDGGAVYRPDGAIATRLTQEIPADVEGNVHDLVAGIARRERSRGGLGKGGAAGGFAGEVAAGSGDGV